MPPTVRMDVLLLRNDPAPDAVSRPWAVTAGILFGRIALLNGLFMTGLALGAGLGSGLARRERTESALTAVLLATAAFIASPFLVEGFNGYRPEQFPVPQNDPLVQPPGWAFSIWGVIYLGLTAYTIYQALPAQRRDPHHVRGRDPGRDGVSAPSETETFADR